MQNEDGHDLHANDPFPSTPVREMIKKQKGELLVALSEEFDESQALLQFETAAVEYESGEGLQKSLQILYRRLDTPKAIELLQSFTGAIFSPSSPYLKVDEGREEEVDGVILAESGKAVSMLSWLEEEVNNLMEVLTTCLAMNVEQHERRVMNLVQRMIQYCSGTESEIVTHHFLEAVLACIENRKAERRRDYAQNSSRGSLFSEEASRERNRTRKAVLEMMINGKQGRQETGRKVDKSKDWKQKYGLGKLLPSSRERWGARTSAVVSSGNAHRKGNDDRWVLSGMKFLGALLRNGAEGVPANALETVRLYERAIEAGDTNTLTNLAYVLQDGAEGVAPDVLRAVKLYERAIEEGNDVYAMDNLAVILQNGAEGVAVDAPRAISLYELAIAEGGGAHPMFNLASLLHLGAEGIEVDVPRAVDMYERAVEGGNVDAMYNLAALLETGTKEIPADAARAVKLYEQAAEQGELKAVRDLANLLLTGAEGVEADARRAVELLERVIEEEGDIDEMVRLANILKIGAKGVDADAPKALRLYEQAIEEARDLDAMNNLGNLLRSGAEGVEANVPRAKKLYEQAIEEGSHAHALYNLAVLLHTGGEGVLADSRRAIELLERAIESANSVGAMLYLGDLLTKGTDEVATDMNRAAELFLRAFEVDGNIEAMVQLAVALDRGAKIDDDAHRIVKLYEEAIEVDDSPEALFSFAVVLEGGVNGVAADAPRAVDLFEKMIERKCNPNFMEGYDEFERDDELAQAIEEFASKSKF